MIILLGFPKSGTTSFDTLFKQLKYKSVHWEINDKYIGCIIQKNKLANLPLLTSLTKYDCITQMDVCMSPKQCYWPQITDFKQLYEENKDAIFILNKRDPEKLVDSICRWKKMNERIYKYNPELISDFDGQTNEDKLLQLINKHYNDVETFFEDKPEAKFISYHITNDTIEKLHKYIKMGPNITFPKKNINTRNPVSTPRDSLL